MVRAKYSSLDARTKSHRRGTDTNRQTLVRKNFTSVLVRLLQQGDMTYVLIPVLYNLCTSFGNIDNPPYATGPILIIRSSRTGASCRQWPRADLDQLSDAR